MSRLRVAVDATPLMGARSGIGWWTGELLSALAAGADLDLVAFGYVFRMRKSLDRLLPPGVEAVEPWSSFLLLARAVWIRTGPPPIEWWTGDVDVVHGTNFVVPRARRAAQVVTLHDLTAWRYPELVHADTLWFPPLVRRALRHGAWVHVNSRAIAEEVHETLGVPEERVKVVMPGIPSVPPAPGARGKELAGGDRYVLALGTVEPRKDLPRLVDAFDAVAAEDSDVRLVIAGADGWGAGALTARIGAAANGGRVVRLGYVSDEDRAALIRGASVLAYPSVYEGFGFPPLEAMSVGVPVVATRAGSLPEVCAGAALLVDVGDTEALAGALASVISDEDVRDALVSAGHDNAARFSWQRTAAEMASLYAEAAGTLAS